MIELTGPFSENCQTKSRRLTVNLSPETKKESHVKMMVSTLLGIDSNQNHSHDLSNSFCIIRNSTLYSSALIKTCFD